VQVWQPETQVVQSKSDASFPLQQDTSPVLLFEHPQYILSLAWPPIVPFSSLSTHTSYLASGSTDGLVHLWQVDPAQSKEQPVQPYLIRRGHMRFVRTVSWSLDGRFIASGGDFGDNTVQVWEAENGNLLSTHTTQYRIFAAPWSPVASLIASGSFDGSVQIWSAFNGECVQKYLGHHGPVYTVAWSPDGTRVVSAGHDTRAIIWSAESGKEMLVYAGHTRAIKTLAWSLDGRYIASGGDDGTVQVWSASDASTCAIYHHTSWVRALSWSPDGAYLVSASGKNVYIWSEIQTE
jgi:WD40 repeat protein